ncbi:hypothetical protein AB0L63_27035 [Nocardia sp. NPDC051990]|uniref:hypothetical protein n=1 Tax=Nocardia sp. NPDC051990 TaxID=3155285 RepID=UPI0034297E68
MLDSALYHCLTDEQRAQYIATVHHATKPGALLSTLCFSDQTIGGLPAPLPVSERNIRDTLSAGGWAITDLSPGELTAVTASAREFVTQYPDAVSDDKGRVLMPIWIVQAQRV